MIEDKINDKYNKELEKYGPNDRRSIFWTKDKQDMRFNALLDEKLKKSYMSILDYGCGFCDLKSFIERNFYNLTYNGCDINKKFIDISKEKFDDNIFLIKNVDDIKETYDIVLVSGTFNLLCIEDTKTMQEYVFIQILKLFEKTNYMLTINFLSHLTDEDYKYPGHFYLNPNELYNFATNNMTKRIDINTHSLPYEITMKFYKNEKLNKNTSTFEIV